MTVACAAAATFCLAASAYAAPPLSGESDGGTYHLYRTPEMWQKLGRHPNLGTGGQMLYYGGSVFSSVKVVSVLWGPNVNQKTVQGMPGFLSAIVNSTFVDQLAPQYDTNRHGVNHKGTHQTITRGTFISQVQITPQNQNTNLTDKMIHTELEYQIANGFLPTQDPNTLYMIYFPNNITISLGGALSCQSFGAYHFATSKRPSATNIFYGVMPDCGYSFNDHTIISAHEFAEATTDNIPTPGSNPAYPQAWNTSTGYEIGDLCEGTQGQLVAGQTTYYVQEVYLNSIPGCGTGNFHSP